MRVPFMPMCARFSNLLLLLFTLLLLASCSLPGEGVRRSPIFSTEPGSEGLPRISTFFSLSESPAPAVKLEIIGLEILDSAVWLPLIHQKVVLDSASIGAGQVLLGGTPLPKGHYNRLRMTIAGARIRSDRGEWTELLAAPLVVYIVLDGSIDLAADDSRSLFLVWDVRSSLTAKNEFFPVFSAVRATRELGVNLLYVSCPEIDTVFVIRTDLNRVVDSFGLSGGPTWMVIDPAGSAKRLHVLTPRERRIKVVDLTTYRVVDYFPFPLNDIPTFMTIDPKSRSAYLLDEESGYLSRMDLSSGRIMGRVAIGMRPQYASYLEGRNLLAVSLGISQKVLLLDPVSLGVRKSLSTGSRPQGLVVANNQLYIAENGNHSISVINLENGISREQFTVGFNPRRLLYTGSQIYIGHEQEGMLTVLMPGQLGVIQEIHDLGLPREMVFHPFSHRIYVVDAERGGLSVIDSNANLLQERISLGALPFGLAVLP